MVVLFMILTVIAALSLATVLAVTACFVIGSLVGLIKDNEMEDE